MPVLHIEDVEPETIENYANASPEARKRAYNALKNELKQEFKTELSETNESKPSKWALLVEEIENGANSAFDGYSETFKKEMKEFYGNR